MAKKIIHPIEDAEYLFEKRVCKCYGCGWIGDYSQMDFDETDHPAYCPVCGYDHFWIEVDANEP